MKKFEPTLAKLIVAFLSLLAAGCEDRIFTETEQQTEYIQFDASVSDSWTDVTRSVASATGEVTDVIPMVSKTTGDTLYLYTEISDYPAATASTRGVQATTGALYDEIEIAAYYYTGSDTWQDMVNTAPNYFCDETARQDNASSFKFISPRYWPAGGTVRFLAYAPSISEATANSSELEANVPRNYWFDKDHANGPRMYVRVPQEAEQQQDLLVAYTEEISCSGTHSAVPVKFQHPLTCIKFTTGDDMIDCTIKKITIENVCSDGNFYFGMDDASNPKALSQEDIITYPESSNSKYEVWGNLQDYTISFGSDGLAVGANMDITSADSNNLLFMMPQKFTKNVWPWENKETNLIIELEHLDDDGVSTVSQTITASLDGRTWPAGKMVTYKLSFRDMILNVDQPKEFSYRGYVYDGSSSGSLDNKISVTSLRCNDSREWFCEIPAGNDWLTIKEKGDDYIVFNAAMASPSNIDIDQRLKAASVKGSTTAPWNLSNSTGAMTIENTANCYMVDAAGTYILPLVYGNAIENGSTNQISYYETASGGLDNFINHAGDNIWTPYMQQNTWNSSRSAELLWQDESGLLTNVQLVANAFGTNIDGIKFEVSQAAIKQGNAVVAVVADGDIMWSWHIWVTNLDFSNTVSDYHQDMTITNASGTSSTVMPVNLGWNSEGETVKYYGKRSCMVKFYSGTWNTQSYIEKYVEVVQDSHLAFPRGSHTYYQWGRKDPFVGTTDGSTLKTGTFECFDDNVISQQMIGSMILNPTKWHIPPYTEPGIIYWGRQKDADGNWIANSGTKDLKDSKDVTYSNLWNNGGRKTIYDPCPVGYRVADADAFTGLQMIDYEDYNAELVETYSLYDNFEILTFPATGYRDWADNGHFWKYSDAGNTWTNAITPDVDSKAYNGSQGCAYYMNFTSTVFIPQDFYYTCDGFAVRPVTQK